MSRRWRALSRASRAMRDGGLAASGGASFERRFRWIGECF